MTNARPTPRQAKAAPKKSWSKPVFKDLRLGFEITMYFWNR
jgi:coenzyme PQQ precursor peptide PqqA